MKNINLAIFFLLFVVLSVPTQSFAGAPPKEPILKIESGFHSAMIRRIDVDRAGKYLVTASDDKTVRLFAADTGRLLQTMRVPISHGNEGKLYSVAISPDGALIAAAGWTGYDWNKTCSIYLFETRSGKLRNVITGLGSSANDLTFSDDGTRLAAVLGTAGQGLHVFNVANQQLLFADKEYGDQGFGVDFNQHGQIVTSCYDGFIRLYDRNFTLLHKKSVSGGKRPFGVRFSPAGDEIAVGFDDTINVNILSTRNLSLVHSPDVTGVARNMVSVAWSADGQTLFAGGMWVLNGKTPVRAWQRHGRGAYQDYRVAEQTIMDINPRLTGGFFAGGGGPMLFGQDQQGVPIFINRPNIADFREILQGFKTSYNGASIRFGYELWGKKPALFNLSKQLLKIETFAENDLVSPTINSSQLTLKNWKYKYNPSLNDKPLKLKKYERSNAVAIHPNKSQVLLGTGWNLRLFDDAAQQIWKISAPATTWAVNISGDGKLALAAYGDGTIRWYRMTDGKELLVLFPHKDQKRWVAWTPSGYYMASPGAEDLIGWHVNNGGEQEADFFPVALFRDKYNRPDVVSAILMTYDEDKAIRMADFKNKRKSTPKTPLRLPPVIKISSPADGVLTTNDKIQITYSLKTGPDSPVRKVRALVNGREARGVRRQNTSFARTGQITVDLPIGTSNITLIAENKNGTSPTSTIQVTREARGGTDFVIKPNLYILAIGVSDYDDDSLDLAFAAKDAKDFANAFKSQEGGIYRAVNARVITDSNADKDTIFDGLDWLERETTSKDMAVLFIAGHGVNDDHGDYYFLPNNANLDRLRRSALPYTEIKRTVANIAGKALFFIDTCHSGNVMGSRRSGSGIDVDSMVNDLVTAENGVVVFASSTGKQYSLESKGWNNGAFTKAIVEGINGGADYSKSGKISINMLDLYISERVKTLTNGRQTPTTTKPKTIPDYPIAVTSKNSWFE